MKQATITQKIKTLERDILAIKKYLGFDIWKRDLDLKNWGRLKKDSRKIREEIFKEKYSGLYAKIQKGK